MALAAAVEAEARRMLRETIERSGWYLDIRPQTRAKRIEEDVEENWRMMAEAARERLEQGRGENAVPPIGSCEEHLELPTVGRGRSDRGRLQGFGSVSLKAAVSTEKS